MKGILLILFWLINSFVIAQHYAAIDSGSSVRFEIDNFGLSVEGSFTGLHGSIFFDPTLADRCYFHTSLKTSTIETGIGLRDRHLRKEDYFHVEAHPEIIFTSTKVESTDKPSVWMITGTLLIKGIKKEVSFPFKFVETNNGYLFEGELRIDRRAFNIGGNSFSLSDFVLIRLSVNAISQNRP